MKEATAVSRKLVRAIGPRLYWSLPVVFTLQQATEATFLYQHFLGSPLMSHTPGTFLGAVIATACLEWLLAIFLSNRGVGKVTLGVLLFWYGQRFLDAVFPDLLLAFHRDGASTWGVEIIPFSLVTLLLAFIALKRVHAELGLFVKSKRLLWLFTLPILGWFLGVGLSIVFVIVFWDPLAWLWYPG